MNQGNQKYSWRSMKAWQKLEWRVTAIYLIFGVCWIFFTDTMVSSQIKDEELIFQLGLYKGWFFVLLSSFLIFALLHYSLIRQRKATARQKEFQERFQKIFEVTNDGILLSTPDGSIFMANPAACRMFGRTENEIKEAGRNGLDGLLDPKLEPLLASKTDDWNGNVELRFARKDGTVFIGEVTNAVFQDDQIQSFITTIIRDITDRKAAEDHIRRQVTALEATANAIVITHNDGSIFWTNPAFLSLTGYTREEVIGKNPRFLKSGEQNKLFYTQMWDTILSGKVWRGELKNLKKDGSLYNEEMTITPLLDSHGNVEYFIAIKQDITERKKFEKNLALSELRYRNLFEDSPVALLEEDYSAVKARIEKLRREGVTDWHAYFADHPQVVKEMAGLVRIIRANKAAVKYHGYHDEEELIQKFNQVFPNSISDRFIDELIHIAHGKHHYSFEAFNKAFNGRNVNIILYFSVVPGYEEDYSKVIISVIDISIQKEIENELRALNLELEDRVKLRTNELQAANISLEKASKLKDEFLANMSHELRTPLTGVLGLSESLQKGIYGPLNEKQMKILFTIEEAGRHLLNLINDILDLSKIEAGKADLQQGVMDISDVCQASIRMVKQIALSKHQTVTYSQEPKNLIMIADSRRIKQILVNLLANAVKFTPENGDLGLEVKGDEVNDEVHFTVWDKGIGISPENMDKLFQPFIQLDGSLTKSYGGTGLGLSLVDRLTRLHNGRIEVFSEVGKGSKFIVTIPWKKAQTDHLMDSSKRNLPYFDNFSVIADNQTNLGTVLLIDDNKINNDMVSDFLKFHGYKVITALDGKQGLEQVAQSHPAIILTDIQIPGMDGLEVIKSIRKMPGEVAKIPIIALTALAMPDDRQRCLEAGADDYLSKPMDWNSLLDAIRNHIGKNK